MPDTRDRDGYPRAEIADETLGLSGVPKSKWAARLERISPASPARRLVEAYAERFRENVERGRGLLFHGPYRVGKSCLASILVRTAMSYRMSACWLEGFELVDGWLADDGRKAAFRKSRFIVVDHLGMEVSGSGRGTLAPQIIQSAFRWRLERCLATVVTTNMSPARLAEVYGEKFMSLVRDFMVAVEIPSALVPKGGE
jgi:DNA replication protein DnaC